MDSRDILTRFFFLVHMMIFISQEQSLIEKDVDHLVNTYKPRAVLCKFCSSETLEAHLEEIDLYIGKIWHFCIAYVISEE